jgi:hypothetical protein
LLGFPPGLKVSDEFCYWSNGGSWMNVAWGFSRSVLLGSFSRSLSLLDSHSHRELFPSFIKLSVFSWMLLFPYNHASPGVMSISFSLSPLQRATVLSKGVMLSYFSNLLWPWVKFSHLTSPRLSHFHYVTFTVSCSLLRTCLGVGCSKLYWLCFQVGIMGPSSHSCFSCSQGVQCGRGGTESPSIFRSHKTAGTPVTWGDLGYITAQWAVAACPQAPQWLQVAGGHGAAGYGKPGMHIGFSSSWDWPGGIG